MIAAMEPDDAKRIAIWCGRGRAVLGLAAVLLPGLVGRLMLGRGTASPTGRALSRMMGARDLVLGVGAITSLNETEHGPEWVSMGAAADLVDGATMLATPGLPRWVRPIGLLAFAAGAVQLAAARRLADDRESRAPTIPAEVPPRPLA